MPLFKTSKATSFRQIIDIQGVTERTTIGVFSHKNPFVCKTDRHLGTFCDFFLTFYPIGKNTLDTPNQPYRKNQKQPPFPITNQ